MAWDSGGPAAGVRVRWIPFGRGGRDPETITDQGGRFRLGPCSPGPGEVQAELPTESRMTGGPRGPHKRQLELAAGANAAGVELVLARNDKTLAGVVLDSDRAAPWPTPPWGSRRTTARAVPSSTGPRTRCAPIPRAASCSSTSPAGATSCGPPTPSTPPPNRPGTEAGASGLRLRFAAGATLAGTVKDARGTAARLFTLTLIAPESPGHSNGFGTGWLMGREEKVNDAGGAFTIERVAPGTYDLLVTSPDGRVARAGGVSLAAGERRRDLALVLGPAATLRGKVVDSETGAPLEGGRVVVMGTREHVHATTDASGAFALTGQIPGRTLRVQVIVQRGYVPTAREIPVPGDRETVDLRPFRLMPDSRQRPTADDDWSFGDAGLRLSD